MSAGTYSSWTSMRQRTLNPRAPKYRQYGGRGITVCDRWNSYENFLADMGERPENTTLDRIDNDGNYEPSNCRWATTVEQRRNQSRTKLTQDDVDWIRSQAGKLSQRSIAACFNINPSTVSLVVAGKIW